MGIWKQNHTEAFLRHLAAELLTNTVPILLAKEKGPAAVAQPGRRQAARSEETYPLVRGAPSGSWPFPVSLQLADGLIFNQYALGLISNQKKKTTQDLVFWVIFKIIFLL